MINIKLDIDKEYMDFSVNGSVEEILKEALIVIDAVCNSLAESAPIKETHRAEFANHLKKQLVDYQTNNLDTGYKAWKEDRGV